MKREQLAYGDTIECSGIKATVLNNFTDNYIKVVLNDNYDCRALINKDWLDVWEFANPIKNNRIISDRTFAIRFREFIKNTEINDPCSEEEKEYLLKVADKLLKYQIQTVTDEDEISYLKTNGCYDNGK